MDAENVKKTLKPPTDMQSELYAYMEMTHLLKSVRPGRRQRVLENLMKDVKLNFL